MLSSAITTFVSQNIGTKKFERVNYFLLSFSHCLSGVLRGAGKSKIPMLTMLSCWCIIRVLYINIVTSLVHDIALVFWAYPITWFLSSIMFFIYYKKSNWFEDFEKKKLLN